MPGPQNQRHLVNNSKKGSGGSGTGDPNDNGSGDNGFPKLDKVESTIETENRFLRLREKVRNLEEDSDSETEEDQCQAGVAGLKGLPKGNFLYDLEQSNRLKKASQTIWKRDKPFQDKVVKMLGKFDDKNAKIEEKSIKGLKKVTELKADAGGPRILIYRGKNQLPKVLGFCRRRDLECMVESLKKYYGS